MRKSAMMGKSEHRAFEIAEHIEIRRLRRQRQLSSPPEYNTTPFSSSLRTTNRQWRHQNYAPQLVLKKTTSRRSPPSRPPPAANSRSIPPKPRMQPAKTGDTFSYHPPPI